MLPTKEIIESLLELGLNKYESKVYLTLISEGISTAKNISDITSIPYGKVYEIINSLATKGFVKILPSKPMKYHAISPKQAMSITKKKIEDKFEEIEGTVIRKLESLFEDSKQFNEPKSVFWVINGRSNINKKIEQMVGQAKDSLHILASENSLKRLVIHKEVLKAAKERGISIMIGGTINGENEEDAKSLGFCDLKNIPEVPSQFYSVDSTECLMVESIPDDEDIVYGRDLGVWITSKPFTNLIEHSFATHYKKGKSWMTE